MNNQGRGQGPDSDSEYGSITSIHTGDPGSPVRQVSAPIPIPLGSMRVTQIGGATSGISFVEVNKAEFLNYDSGASDESSDPGQAVAAVAAVIATGPRTPEGRRLLVDYGSDTTSGRHEFVDVQRDICL
jgi:hypothetical protein